VNASPTKPSAQNQRFLTGNFAQKKVDSIVEITIIFQSEIIDKPGSGRSGAWAPGTTGPPGIEGS
jgi:hypothetical protein